jgi:Glycosyltransferase family 87
MREGEPGWFHVGDGQQRYRDGKDWTDQSQDIDEVSAPQPAGSHSLAERPMRERRLHGTRDLMVPREGKWGPPMATSERLETLKRAFWVALIPGAILFMAMQTIGYARAGMIGADSHAYWIAVRFPETWYTNPPEYRDAFLYSPAFAQALWPLGQLQWPAFQTVWITGQAGVLAWLLAPLGWQRGLTLAPFFIAEILLGNVYLFFAGALVVSLGRAPGALALPVLTKVAPSVVGIWFVVRREWHAALWAAGFTALIVAVSAAIAPAEWLAWAQFLSHSAGQRGGTATLRLAAALGITVWAARTGRAWLLAPALILGCPVLGGYSVLAVLAAIPRLVQFERTERAAKALDTPHEQSRVSTVARDCTWTRWVSGSPS